MLLFVGCAAAHLTATFRVHMERYAQNLFVGCAAAHLTPCNNN